MWNPYKLWPHRLSQAAVRTLDGIIDTVSANHEISQLLPLLDVDGTLVLLGVPVENHTFHTESVLFSRRAALSGPQGPNVLMILPDWVYMLLGVPVENHTLHTESVLFSRCAPSRGHIDSVLMARWCSLWVPAAIRQPCVVKLHCLFFFLSAMSASP